MGLNLLILLIKINIYHDKALLIRAVVINYYYVYNIC